MTEQPPRNGSGASLPPPERGRNEVPSEGRGRITDARAAGLRRSGRRAAPPPATPPGGEAPATGDLSDSLGSMLTAAAWPGAGTAPLFGPVPPEPTPLTGPQAAPAPTPEARRSPMRPAVVVPPSIDGSTSTTVNRSPVPADVNATSEALAAQEETTDLGHVRAALAHPDSAPPPSPIQVHVQGQRLRQAERLDQGPGQSQSQSQASAQDHGHLHSRIHGQSRDQGQATSRLDRDELARGAATPTAPPGAAREQRPSLVISALSGGAGASTITGLLRAELSRRFGGVLPLRHRDDDDGATRVTPPSLPPAPPHLPTLVDAGPHGLDRTRIRDGPIVLVCDAAPHGVAAATAAIREARAEGVPVLALAVVTTTLRRSRQMRDDDGTGAVTRIDIPFDPALANDGPLDAAHLAAETTAAIGELADAILTVRAPARTA